MIQKQYKAVTVEDLENYIEVLASSEEYKSAKSTLVTLFTEIWEEEKVEAIVDICNERLKDAVVVGVSNANWGEAFVLRMVRISVPEKPGQNGQSSEHYEVIMNVIFFEESEAELHTFEINEDHCELFKGGAMGQIIADSDNVKGVLLFAAGIYTSVEDFCTMLVANNPDIPIFGSKSAVMWNYEAELYGGEGYLYTKKGIIQHGFAAIVLKGENLHIRTGYNFGWTPIGKTMHITDMEGDTLVHTIDDKPAAEIYRRYLGLENYQIISENVCEFPFAIKRGDRYLARIGLRTYDDDSLQFSAPVYEGDELRLTYGNENEILGESYADSLEVGAFEPQAILMIECGNRSILMKKHMEIEYDYYRQYCSELAIIKGHAEILMDRYGGGELNSTLVSVAMREGDTTGNIKHYPVKSDVCPVSETRIPITQRMTIFLEAMTGELVDAIKEAERANRAKTDFLSNISHEIRTPVNAVLGLDEMILRESRDDNITRYATDIQNAGRNLLSLINDILDSSRIESGKLEIIPVEYELSSVLNDLVNMTSIRASDKDLELVVDVAQNIPHVLKGDDTRIRQCALNILTNAVKYTQKGSITMKVFSEKTDNNHIGLTFTISDTGIGIKEEDMEKLFGRFERIEEDRNRTIEGTGLGMSIVQKLLAMMDSKLYVDSIYGEGSTFSFTVIQEVINNEPIGDFTAMYERSMETEYHESFRAPDARILVVDDTRMNLTVVRGLLKKTEIGIDTAESGGEALVMLGNQAYDIVFLDQRMPEMDGIETFKRMKHLFNSKNRETPVIMLTANAVSGAREMFLAEGFDDYLSKPIEGSKLEEMIVKYLPEEKVLPAIEKEETDDSNDSDFVKELKTISGYNVSDGLTNCMGEELLAETIRDFVASVKKNIGDISGFLENDDLENYTIRVHSIKSSARIIGANDISERARALEELGDNKAVEKIMQLTPGLLKDYDELAKKLASAVGADYSSEEEAEINDEQEAISREELESGISAIRELIEAFDFDGAQGILDMLMAGGVPKEYENKLKAIYEHIRRLERDELLQLLD